jgi:heme A synthase
MPAPAPSFRKLALATVVLTFVLIVIGGIVRVSGSGLGCGPAGSGFHGWPFCNGDVVPGVDLNAIIEYVHRVVAAAVGLMMFALAWLAWRRYPEHRGIAWASLAAAVLVVLQGVLGGVVVEENLEEELVAAHLALAMLLLGLVIYIWRASRPEVIGAEPPQTSAGFRRLAWAASILILGTIIAGGYMAGTQKYGRADYQLGDGAHHACGKEFPTCNGDFLPFGQARLVDIHLTHRVFVYLASAIVLWLAIAAIRRRLSEPVTKLAGVTVVALVAQLLVGALNVWLDEYELLIVTHLALGTLLWALCVAITLNLYRVPAPAPAAVGSRPEAVSA